MPIDPRFLAYLAIAVVASAALIDIATRAFRWYLDREPTPRRRIRLDPDSRQEIPVYEELQEVALDDIVVHTVATPGVEDVVFRKCEKCGCLGAFDHAGRCWACELSKGAA
jgi:hypothetical protein